MQPLFHLTRGGTTMHDDFRVRSRTIQRREILKSAGMACGSLVFCAELYAKTHQPSMQQTPSTDANQKRTALHQEIPFTENPQRIYEIFLDSKQFAAFTTLGATIDPKPGGAFSTFGGLIEGRNVELLPSQRLVQAFRPTHWDPGVYSIVRFELKPQATGTLVVLDHTGFPEGDYDHLNEGWQEHYWQPLQKYLG
jgi:activator of HSP90 ATPase